MGDCNHINPPPVDAKTEPTQQHIPNSGGGGSSGISDSFSMSYPKLLDSTMQALGVTQKESGPKPKADPKPPEKADDTSCLVSKAKPTIPSFGA